MLEATYRERTGIQFDAKDYVSFGLADKNGLLANAEKLLADHYMVFNSRRGSGLKKILSETEKLPDYTPRLRPEFCSEARTSQEMQEFIGIM